MTRILATELIKLKRSAVFWIFAACLAIPFARGLLDILRQKDGSMGWPDVLSLRLEYWALGTFVILLIVTSHLFTKEYEGNTIQSVFATPHPTFLFLFSKLLIAVLFLAASMALSLAIRFIQGLVFAAGPLTSAMATDSINHTFLMTVQFALLVPWIAAMGILGRKMFAATLICLGSVVMLFPFGQTDAYYFFPHLVPVVHFSKTIGFDRSDRMFTPEGWISLGLFFILAFSFCVYLYRKK
jgi:ABC-type transport system involved in multi-copper enzyme maturation permease subunit